MSDSLSPMYRLILRLLSVVLLMVGGTVQGWAQSLEHFNRTDARIQSLMDSKPVRDATWSLTVRDSAGAILEAWNSDHLMRPASNLKLLTSAALLNKLGPDFRFQTPVYGIGELQDSVWSGDLLIVGKGDPTISGTLYNGDRFHVFEQIFQSLDSLGIQRITGNVIGNDAYFDDIPYPKGWNWDDLSFYYGVEINALSFNDNCVDLVVYADGDIGDTPRIEWFPYQTDYVNFINEQIIAPRNTEYDEYYRRILGTNTIILRSSLPKGYLEKESLSVANPSLFFVDTFYQFLQDSGIHVEGQVGLESQLLESERKEEYNLLHTYVSPPFSELITEINKESDNFYTEMLVKKLAAQTYGAPGSTETGVGLVREYAHEIGIDTSQVVMSDGSGMSTRTLLTTEALSRLLVAQQEYDYFPMYLNSLSVAGIDGTLQYRFGRSPVRGHIQGKSGYMSGVRSMSGYLTTESGQRLTFSLITNHYRCPTREVDHIQEQIMEYLFHKY
jgi:D-alanyl-D-alanine carboxypeptidase/D-alanyl-D-alanine-endopeptidase (penicillin-binding protein 4)